MPRAFLVVLDSVGCGGAPDAARFGDAGADTLGHIVDACAAGDAETGRSGPLYVPTMAQLGLGSAMAIGSGQTRASTAKWPDAAQSRAFWGAAEEISIGKDTPSGHWELAGVPVPWDWHYFPDRSPAFPDDVVRKVCELAGTEGILGNCHASGTAIIEELGAEHLKTGWPICYTSADSVFQIAAHEGAFGLDKLIDLCKGLAPMLHDMKVGRVIARPFVGDTTAGFERTANRRDFAIAPPSATLCDWVSGAGGDVLGIGKIGDIFSMRGIDRVVKGTDAELAEHLNTALKTAPDNSLTFANFVEFDSLYGHRRDVAGYARALEWFDVQLAKMIGLVGDGDLLLITADHGNDPTWRGTDHTRERVPVIGIAGGGAVGGEIGLRAFSDVAASVAAHLGVPSQGPGRSFL